jgi:hypothetical protein
MTGLPVLGWKEHGALPDWGIRRLRMKLDTGARTSAIHVSEISIIEEETPLVRFAVVLGRHPGARRRLVTTPLVGVRTVRDTGAKREQRPVVRTRVVVGPVETITEVTVTDRTGMNFRMILGRTALAETCLVDPSRGYVWSHPPPRRKNPGR